MLNYHRERFRKLTFPALALRQLSKSFTVVIQHLSTRLIKPNFCFDLPHRRSTTISLETRNLFYLKISLGQVNNTGHTPQVSGHCFTKTETILAVYRC